jgi:AraC family transcriptional regulator of adaptative response / DNA-3-methyladenine glycosylase II
VRTFGRPVKTSIPGLTHIFPGPEDLAEASLGDAGIREAPASSIKALARAVLQGDLTFEASINLQDALARVRAVPGISQPVADYLAMRAFGEPDAFPLPTATVRHTPECWRPWRAYAAMHLYGAGLVA